MKKIVILGSSGLLGLNLCLILKNKNKIYPIINKKKIKIENLEPKYLNLSKKDKIEKSGDIKEWLNDTSENAGLINYAGDLKKKI